MSASAANLQVEKVLDDLISKLTKGTASPESKAALIEARRLRNVTMRWAAIPPPPDARREMLTRVMELVSKAGLKASVPPAAPSAPPPPPANTSGSPRRAMSEDGPAALGFGAPQRSATRDRVPTVGKGQEVEKPVFREASTSRHVKESVAPRRPAPERLPELDEVAPPKPLGARPSSEPPTLDGRTLSPTPQPVVKRAPTISDVPPALGAPRSLSPLPGQRTLSPPRGTPAAGLGRFATGSNTKQFGRASDMARQLARETSPKLAASPAASATPTPAPRKAETLEFDLDEPKPEAAAPRRSAAPPEGSLLPPTPRVDPSVMARAMSEGPGPLRKPPPHRAHTIAGIPEANEALAQALFGKKPTLEEADSFDEVARRSNMPTAAPPPPSVRGLAGPASSRSPASSGSTGAPPPLRHSKTNTLAMGALDAGAALAALKGTRAPALPDDDLFGERPPSTKPSTPAPSEEGPASRRGAELPRTTPPPISAPGANREGKMEGLSSAISSPGIPAVRKQSSQTQTMGTPTPPPVGGQSQPPSKQFRTVVAPGVTIVRPDAAQWQPHPELPGVTMKVLFRDPRSGLYTALLRLAPGSALPRRRHATSEEMLLVSGLATVGSHEMRAGEYSRAESDATHEPITTTTGCTFFVSGSEHDEFLRGG